jgi:hypothetical protein
MQYDACGEIMCRNLARLCAQFSQWYLLLLLTSGQHSRARLDRTKVEERLRSRGCGGLNAVIVGREFARWKHSRGSCLEWAQTHPANVSTHSV